MATYLIDYENVKSEGIKGITQLSEEDTVVIFYSHNADTITFEAMDMIFSSKAQVRKYKILCGGKNALDFQLSTYLGYLIHEGGDSYFYIISKDNGFKHVVDFWKRTFKYDGYVYCFPTIGDGNARQQRFKNATAKERQIVMEEELVAMSEELQAQEEQKESDEEESNPEDNMISEVISYEDTPEEEDLAAVRRFKTESKQMEALFAAEKKQQADGRDASVLKEAGAENEKAAEKNVSVDDKEAVDRKTDEGSEKAAEKKGEDRKKAAEEKSEAREAAKKTDDEEREKAAGNKAGTEKERERTADSRADAERTKEHSTESKAAADNEGTAEKKAAADNKGTAEKETAAVSKAAAGSETAAVKKSQEPVMLSPIHESKPVSVTPPAQLPESVRRELQKADEAYAGTKNDEKLQEKIQSAVTLPGVMMRVVDTGVTVHQTVETAEQKNEPKADQEAAGKEKQSRHSHRSSGRSKKNPANTDREAVEKKKMTEAVKEKAEKEVKEEKEEKTAKNEASGARKAEKKPVKKSEKGEAKEEKQAEKKSAKKSVKKAEKNETSEEKQTEKKETEEKKTQEKPEEKQTEKKQANSAEKKAEISTKNPAENAVKDVAAAETASDNTGASNHQENAAGQAKKSSGRGRRPKVQKNNAAEFEK